MAREARLRVWSELTELIDMIRSTASFSHEGQVSTGEDLSTKCSNSAPQATHRYSNMGITPHHDPFPAHSSPTPIIASQRAIFHLADEPVCRASVIREGRILCEDEGLRGRLGGSVGRGPRCFKFPTCQGVGNTASIPPKRPVRNA